MTSCGSRERYLTPGNNSSAVFEINGHGVGAGISETGTIELLQVVRQLL
jgi:hypothetical protein